MLMPKVIVVKIGQYKVSDVYLQGRSEGFLFIRNLSGLIYRWFVIPNSGPRR